MGTEGILDHGDVRHSCAILTLRRRGDARGACSWPAVALIGNPVGVRSRLVLAVAALLVAAGVATPTLLALTRRSAGAATADVAFRAAALDSRLHFLVRLPAGYARGTRRYPVVYFLHGLPAGPTSYRAVAWVEEALDHAGRPAILVVPQGTRRLNGDPEYHDWGPGHNWATALGVELPAYVDAHYRTIATRAGRAIVGVSAGGYGAASIGLGHPGRFSVVESWSGYFEPTDPTGTKVLDLGSARANKAASVHALAHRLGPQFRRDPTLLAFYVGRGDPTFVGENRQLNRELTAAHVPHQFAVYPGGHTVALWRAHARAWLAMALRRLAPAR
jgi:enterochelin esterase-like enzyme